VNRSCSVGNGCPADDRPRRTPFEIQSLTINRGGQSRRWPSRWACNNASVQSWKKWLRSLNPKSRTIRSNVSRCSRRTLVVRLPCAFWVNPVSVFILDELVAASTVAFASRRNAIHAGKIPRIYFTAHAPCVSRFRHKRPRSL
jgi:hypothetical protein